ncbi:glutamate 5-kinase [Adlercreutzia sp. ZJ154]|uniref:glutamate 5-kinase n=1 Tax=Adlercreutzia sp. ZJ154 TaxID=2709790 RepID=UPI001F14C6AE|nr:glutamate 5-kinase [Adlercreutzia sp. ZJ154]
MDTEKRLVVKIGSSTLMSAENAVDSGRITNLVDQVAKLVEDGWQVVIVTSAAIAAGLGALSIEKRPKDMATLQAAASVGQCELSGEYAKAFARHNILTSLVLLTRRDTADRTAYLNARATLDRLLSLGVVPIVNENDTVSVEQIRFGDNDTLAALVACLVGANLLVILSDIDGLYNSNPRANSNAQLISVVNRIDRSIVDACGGAGSVAGSGGMITKVSAARVMMSAGIPMVIAHGCKKDVVLDAALGKSVGTLFCPGEAQHEITSRKLWIALGDAVHGSIVVDEGAKYALIDTGSSLLAVGIIDVEGHFVEGDIVEVRDSQDYVFARGKVNVQSDAISLVCGMSTEEILENSLLAPIAEKPVIHRDDLVVFE